MADRRKKFIKLVENIGLILFGITNAIGGTYMWSEQPFFTISLCILSVVCVVHGASILLDIISKQGNQKFDDA